MVHHPMAIIKEPGVEEGSDADDALAGRTIGKEHASPLNLYDFARRYGFLFYTASPTSGLSLNRALADLLFPIPEEGITTSADDFIVMGASLLGDLHSLGELLGCYRVHGQNAWFGDRRRPEAVRQRLNSYLNDKLVANGLQPVMRSAPPLNIWSELARDKRWLPILTDVLKTVTLQRSSPTARYAYAALRLATKRQSEIEDTSSDPLV
jgi:hypothetical protein